MRVLTDFPNLPTEAVEILIQQAGEARTPRLVCELDYAGFEIVRKPAPTASAPTAWILKEVVPGEVLVQPYNDRTSVCDHQVIVTAKALLTRATSGDQRELTVRTAWICGEDAVEYSVGQALSLALRQAREAAAAFITVTSPAPATDTEEAA